MLSRTFHRSMLRRNNQQESIHCSRYGRLLTTIALTSTASASRMSPLRPSVAAFSPLRTPRAVVSREAHELRISRISSTMPPWFHLPTNNGWIENRHFSTKLFSDNDDGAAGDDGEKNGGSGNEDLSIGSKTEIQDRIERISKMSPRELVISKSGSKADTRILNEVLDWVERVVIGLNLCPFAEKPFLNKTLHIEVVGSSSGRKTEEPAKKRKKKRKIQDAKSSVPAPVTDDMIEDIFSHVLSECFLRRGDPDGDGSDMIGHTSLLVCPQLFPNDFEKFLEVYNMFQDGVLVDNDLVGDIQIAPFHPLFEFDGSGSDGVDNYTNRSPYPIFHILREKDVSNAVDILDGDASIVWKRNVKLLGRLHEEYGTNNDGMEPGSITKATTLEQIMCGKQLAEVDQEKIRDICLHVSRQARKEAKEEKQGQESE